MNLFVADPEWGWWIVAYFFLGGIAAGAYFLATLIDLLGQEGDGELARMGYWIAFPLVSVCGILLILDLHEPARFWHMLFKSEIVDDAIREGWPARGWGRMVEAPLLKRWSPMSIGSWALLLFGFCSSLSFIGSLRSEGRVARILRHGVVGRFLQIVGSLVGFFVAAYTGALLTATNQPVWSDSVFVAPLFLTSAASTGLALMMAMAWYRGVATEEAMHRMERADLWVLGLELVALAAFLASLGPSLTLFLSTWAGMIFVLGALVLGVIIPLAFHMRLGISGLRSATVAAMYVLVGGFLLRFTVLRSAPELLTRGPAHLGLFSPEDERAHGAPGADPGNHLPDFQPHSKLTGSGHD